MPDMIHWLIQSFDDCPEILRQDATPAWLSDDERRRLAGFRVEKRRQEWLLGRWTAKRLTQTVLRGDFREDGNDEWPLDRLLVAADASGAPYVSLQTEGQRLPFSLSISHSHGVAFCAIARTNDAHDDPGATHDQSRTANQTPDAGQDATQHSRRTHCAVGADIELVEGRTATFVVDFFTPAEQSAIVTAPAEQRDLLATAIWSAKEAVLKALREGLRVDTRLVECLIDLSDPPPQEWTPFPIRVDERTINQAGQPSSWSGWWRMVEGRFVLTLATRSSVEFL
jgi:4'-phosphopantetheinyl transferase